MDAPATPCGLVARSFFNDTFVLKKQGGDTVKIAKEGIAWQSDMKYKFKNVKEAVPEGKTWEDVQWQDHTDGKSILVILYLYFNLYRAFYCLDERGRIAEFQKTLGNNCRRPRERKI